MNSAPASVLARGPFRQLAEFVGADPLAARRQVLAGAIPQARTLVLSGDHLTVVTNPRFAAAIVDFLAQPG
jgi:hypothetical protein